MQKYPIITLSRCTVHRRWIALGVVLAAAAGCGAKYPELARVRGVVRVSGATATSGMIQYHPTSGGRTALGQIQPDGTYELTTFEPGDGAKLGSHVVTIRSTKVAGAPAPASLEEELSRPASSISNVSKIIWLIDEKYSKADASDITAEVKSGENTIDFDLPSPSRQ